MGGFISVSWNPKTLSRGFPTDWKNGTDLS